MSGRKNQTTRLTQDAWLTSPVPRPAQVPTSTHPGRGHGHLWQLPDGTGLHAPMGVLVRSPDQLQVCCHLCGRWFRHLGAHLRTHGVTASAYRELLGLLKTQPLTSSAISTEIAGRQRLAYRADAGLRERFQAGQQMARNGQLSWMARRSPVSLARATDRAERLAAGRTAQDKRRNLDVEQRLDRLGAVDLHNYLRERYAAGASLEALAKETGLGRGRLRDAVSSAGIAVRGTGATTLPGRRSRALAVEASAAARVGAPDLLQWLTAQRDAGRTLAELGHALGRSVPWVRGRIRAGEVSSAALHVSPRHDDVTLGR